jgi:hypothetical protein
MITVSPSKPNWYGSITGDNSKRWDLASHDRTCGNDRAAT